MTLKEIIIKFMEGTENGVATLKEIYNAVDESIQNNEYRTNSDTVHDSARCIIYRHEESFKRLCKGIYMLKGKNTASLLIEGDGRKLDEMHLTLKTLSVSIFSLIY